jgi:hypothetical protein
VNGVILSLERGEKMVYLVSYDLHSKKSENYEAVHSAIEKFPAHCHVLESTWIIGTRLDLTAVMNRVQKVMGKRDSLIVVEALNYTGYLEEEHLPVVDGIFSKYGYDE